jgi:hypothetical protein
MDTLMDIPKRVFLDTNVVNFILDHGSAIFEGTPIKVGVGPIEYDDIAALQEIFFTGQRAAWQIVVSDRTLAEIGATQNSHRRIGLLQWFHELNAYSITSVGDDQDALKWHATDFARRAAQSSFFDPLPDLPDRELICHAVAYGCDAFCTQDRRSILRHRHRLGAIPLALITPLGWRETIRDWSALFA